MSRLLKADLEAEAITLEADAARIKAKLEAADLGERELAAAMKAVVEPRLEAAKALRAAKHALECIPAMGIE